MTTGFRVLVCGGRDFLDRRAVFKTLDAIHALSPISLLIHGACCDRETGELRGADGLAERWAILQQIPYCGMPANWRQFGTAAGPIRNAAMLARWKPHRVVAFPGGRGTASMMKRARAAGVEVTEVDHAIQ